LDYFVNSGCSVYSTCVNDCLSFNNWYSNDSANLIDINFNVTSLTAIEVLIGEYLVPGYIQGSCGNCGVINKIPKSIAIS